MITDPQKWDREQVQVWLKFMLEQYVTTSPVPNIEYIFNEDGEQLSLLNQVDFTNRLKVYMYINTINLSPISNPILD